MKVIKGDLTLTKDTVFEESIKVEGHIKGKDNERFNLRVAGNINAWDIDAGDIDAVNINAGNINARDIDAVNIDAGDIDAGDIDAVNINAGDIDAGDIDAVNINAVNINAVNINAGDIDAGDIDAWDIIVNKHTRKSKTAKVTARIYITNKSDLERKEW
jgi:hypothetical protein